MQLERIEVFIAGADGVHTYRIPSLLVAPGGTLLAFCEARKMSGRDASPTDMVIKRSTNGGRTWGSLQVVVTGLGEEAIMNPCPVVDGERVVLFCMNAHKTAQGRHRHLVLVSEDDGVTWSPPRDVTEQVGDDTFIPGPGVSVRMRAGRLVVPGYSAKFNDRGERLATFSRAVLSDDGGETWRLGEHNGYAMSNECQAAELSDGRLVLNWRIQKGDPGHPGCRGVAHSADGGASWGEPQLARALNALPCQGGLISATAPDGGHRLLFSNPDAHPGMGNARTRMCVKLSRDDGETWPAARLIDAGRAAYSCPAVLPDGTIALLYESGEATPYQRIRLARFGWDWLEDGTGG